MFQIVNNFKLNIAFLICFFPCIEWPMWYKFLIGEATTAVFLNWMLEPCCGEILDVLGWGIVLQMRCRIRSSAQTIYLSGELSTQMHFTRGVLPRVAHAFTASPGLCVHTHASTPFRVWPHHCSHKWPLCWPTQGPLP